MCRNIKTLFNFEPPATEEEIRASSLQFVRKPATHRDALADVVVELMNSGLDYYFMQPLKLAKAGFIVQQSANLDLAGAQQVMGPSSATSSAASTGRLLARGVVENGWILVAVHVVRRKAGVADGLSLTQHRSLHLG